MSNTDQEIAHKRELIVEYRKRLYELEKKAARLGIDVPPQVTIEIEEIRGKIATLEQELETIWTGRQIEARWEEREALRAKDHVAIIVNISRPIPVDVIDFLQREKIDANIVTISSVQELEEERANWEGVVSEFFQAFNEIQRIAGARTTHIFISAPSALAFAMGCLLGTHYDVHLYHWFSHRRSYREVIQVSRRLLAGIGTEL